MEVGPFTDLQDILSIEKLLEGIHGPEEFSLRFQKGSPSKRARYVHAVVKVSMSSPSSKDLLLSLSGARAVEAVEEIQELLDASTHCDECWGQGPAVINLRRLLVSLSRKCQILPDVLFVDGIDCPDKNPIAGGGYADIYLATFKGQVVALKRFRTFSTTSAMEEAKERGEFYREALVWRDMRHPNVQPFIGVDAETFNPFLCMVSPWQENGSILMCLERLERDIGIPIVLDVLVGQSAAGLWYLHSNNIVHGDLHAGNVLMDQHFNVRLSDFGLARFGGTSSSSQGSSIGSVRFCAPELLAVDEPQACASFATDMYSFGCLCLQIHTRKPPFPDIISEGAVIARLLRGTRPTRPFESTLARNGFWEYIEQCWSANPAERPASQSLVESLPLQAPVFSTEGLEALPHSEWTLTASGGDTSSFNGADSRSIDPCIIGLIPVDVALIPRIRELGCPENVVALLQERWNSTPSPIIHFPTDVDHTQSPTPRVEESHLDVTPPQDETTSRTPPPDGKQPEVFQRAAESLFSLSEELIRLEQFSDASRYLRQAVEIHHKLATDHPDEFNPPLAASLRRLTFALYKSDQYKEGIDVARDTVKLLQELQQQNPEKFAMTLVESHLDLSLGFLHIGDRDMALSTIRRAADVCRTHSQAEPAEFQPMLSHLLLMLYLPFVTAGRFSEGSPFLEEVVEVLRSLQPEIPEAVNCIYAYALHHRALVQFERRDFHQALTLLKQSIEIFRSLPDDAEDNTRTAYPLRCLCMTLLELGRYQEAVDYGEEAVKIFRLREDSEPGENREAFALTLNDLATAYAKLKQPLEASKAGTQAARILRELARLRPDEFRGMLFDCLQALHTNLTQCGHYGEAIYVDRELAELKPQMPAKGQCVIT